MKRFYEIGRDFLVFGLVVIVVGGGWYATTPKEPRVTLESSVMIEVVIPDVVPEPHVQPQSPQPPPADPPKTEFEKSGGSVGSGTVIGHNTFRLVDGKESTHSIILTNEHVVKGAPSVFVYWKGQKFEGRVIAKDDKVDLALVEVSVILPKADLLAGPLWDGENTWVVGYPFGLSASITHGFISPKGSKELRQESASIWFGNSGGGVFVLRDGRYVLAGVTDAIYVRPYMGGILFANTVGFFVPMESVKEFLADNHVMN